MKATMALLVGILAGWGGAHLIEFAVFGAGPRASPPPCFEVGAPFHHRFRPNCTEMLATPRGQVRFSTNSEGVRDAYRASLLASTRRVLLLGDSFVEGWWAEEGQTLSAALSARFPGITFINGGIRSTGPLLQAKRLEALLAAYKPEKVLWLLNDTDGPDDRLACALFKNRSAPLAQWEFSANDFTLTGWKARLARALGGMALGRQLNQLAYEERWKELSHSEPSAFCDACLGVREIVRLLRKAKVGLFPVFLISGGTPAVQYKHEAAARSEASARNALLTCLEASGRKAHVHGPMNQERDYWENDFHLNPEGMQALAEQMLPALKSWLAVRAR